MNENLAYDLDGLAVDVFSLVDSGTAVESLTGAHGMTELAASCPTCGSWIELFCSGSCASCATAEAQ
jgi:hypothetical protein